MVNYLILIILSIIGGLIRGNNFYAPLNGRAPRNKWERMYGIPVLNREEQKIEGAVNMYGGWMIFDELPSNYPIKEGKRLARCVGDTWFYPPMKSKEATIDSIEILEF